jgi:hypothetical protein
MKRRKANSHSISLSEQQCISLQVAVCCLVSNKIKGERIQCHWLFPEGFASHSPPLTEHVTSINTMLYCLHCRYAHRILLVAQRLRKISVTGLDSCVSARGAGEQFCEHDNVTWVTQNAAGRGGGRSFTRSGISIFSRRALSHEVSLFLQNCIQHTQSQH